MEKDKVKVIDTKEFLEASRFFLEKAVVLGPQEVQDLNKDLQVGAKNNAEVKPKNKIK